MQHRRRVVVWVIDGLDPARVTPRLMPNLTAIGAPVGRADRIPGTTWRRAHGVMVAETCPNHAALFTGADGSVNGVPANRVWEGDRYRLANPSHLTAQTIFGAIDESAPHLRTATLLADPVIHNLVSDEPVGDHWNPADAGVRRIPFAWFPFDHDIVDLMARRLADGVDALFVNTQFVDASGHATGPGSPVTKAAMRNVDRAFGRFVTFLRSSGLWDDTVLFVLSDHGMCWTLRKLPLGLWLRARGVRGWKVADSGCVALLGHVDGDPTADELQRVRDVARNAPGVAAVEDAWNPRLGHLVVHATPGWSFFDPLNPIPGNHGAVDALEHWLAVTGGGATIADGIVDAGTVGRIVDVAPTVAALLDVAAPSGAHGRILSEALPELDATAHAVATDDATAHAVATE